MADVITPPAETPQPPPAQPPADPTPPEVNATPPAPSAAVMTPNPVTPTHQMVTVQHRGGLAGIVDEFRNALAGPQTTQITTDDNGNKVVTPVKQTPGQQWMKIAATAARGAGAGYAAGQGPGGGGRAVGAGFQVSDEQAEQQRKQTQDQRIQARQDNLDQYNQVKQKLDLARSSFELSNAKANAGQQATRFSQENQKFEEEHGSIDLGVYHDENEAHKVLEQDPKFWEHYHGTQIVHYDEISPDGKYSGVHAYLRTTKPGDEVVPAGTPVPRWIPAMKPGEQGHLEYSPSTSPMKMSVLDAAKADAAKSFHDETNEELKRQETTAKIASEKEEPNLKRAQAREQNALAAQHAAEAEQARAATASLGSGGPNDVNQDIAEGLASGRYLMGKDVPLRTTKDQTAAAIHTHNANMYSMQHYGLPYSPTMIRAEDAYYHQPKTQAYLNGMDRMLGLPGIQGQLDQVLTLAQKAGVRETAPIQEIRQAIKQKMGEAAAKSFEEGLSDTQTSLGTLIGNPLLGGGESDLKLKTAQKQFGSNISMSGLRAQVATTKEILDRARSVEAAHNRYIQQRYDGMYSPKPAATQPPAAANAQTGQGAPGGSISVTAGGKQYFFTDQKSADTFKKSAGIK